MKPFFDTSDIAWAIPMGPDICFALMEPLIISNNPLSEPFITLYVDKKPNCIASKILGVIFCGSKANPPIIPILRVSEKLPS